MLNVWNGETSRKSLTWRLSSNIIIIIKHQWYHIIKTAFDHCVKNDCIPIISGPYFSVFGLNKEIFGLNLRI